MTLQKINSQDLTYNFKRNISKNQLLPKILKTSLAAFTILGIALLPSAFLTFVTVKGMTLVILPASLNFMAGFFLCSTAAAAAVLAYLTGQKQNSSTTEKPVTTEPITTERKKTPSFNVDPFLENTQNSFFEDQKCRNASFNPLAPLPRPDYSYSVD